LLCTVIVAISEKKENGKSLWLKKNPALIVTNQLMGKVLRFKEHYTGRMDDGDLVSKKRKKTNPLG